MAVVDDDWSSDVGLPRVRSQEPMREKNLTTTAYQQKEQRRRR
jgi:hypothetical protein